MLHNRSRIGVSGHQKLDGRLAAAGISRTEASSWRWTERRLRELLLRHDPRHVTLICSLAVGTDQVFARIALKLQAKLHVIVPSRNYEATFIDRRQKKRFRDLLSHAQFVQTLDYPNPTETAFFAAGKCIVDQCDQLLAVWDGASALGLGGTADVVKYALSRGRPVTQIDPITLTVTTLL